MKSLNITAKIKVCNYEELNSSEKNVINKAKEALKGSYSPYSHFQVGTAVLLTNQEIFTGNNQENAAYPSGLCAERTALFYANAQYPDVAVDMIAIAAYTNGGYTENPVSPCGACRQVILEAQNRFKHPIKLILYGEKEIYIIDNITDIFPLSFGSDELRNLIPTGP